MQTDYHLEDFQEFTHNSIFKSAIRHSHLNKKSESCGLFIYDETFTNCSFVPLNNENTHNSNLFSMNDNIFFSLYQKKRIVSLFHSHIDYDENLSNLDIEVAESFGLPSMVYSLLTKELELYYPESHQPNNLFRRVFIPFFQDCMIFVKDYFYLKLNINLSTKIKNWSRKKQKTNENLLSTMNQHFFEVKQDNSELLNGDVVIFSPDYRGIFHLGVYEDHYLLHHPIYQLPKKEIFTTDIMNKVYKIYRYKDL